MDLFETLTVRIAVGKRAIPIDTSIEYQIVLVRNHRQSIRTGQVFKVMVVGLIKCPKIALVRTAG